MKANAHPERGQFGFDLQDAYARSERGRIRVKLGRFGFVLHFPPLGGTRHSF
jgi:hypothetical protein